MGARTLNILGEPAVSLHGVLDILSVPDPDITVVWNSNMYYCQVVSDVLEGLVDIYLADLKCGNPDCAQAMLGAGDYLDVVRSNIVRVASVGQVIVRHVILPGHQDCCLGPILRRLAEYLPDVLVSLRSDYVLPAEPHAAPDMYLEYD